MYVTQVYLKAQFQPLMTDLYSFRTFKEKKKIPGFSGQFGGLCEAHLDQINITAFQTRDSS